MTTEEIMALAERYADSVLRVSTGQTNKPESLAAAARQALLTAVDGLVALTEQCKINVALYKQIADDKSAAVEALVRDALIVALGQPVPLSEWQKMEAERDSLRKVAQQALEAFNRIIWDRHPGITTKQVERMESIALAGAAELQNALRKELGK